MLSNLALDGELLKRLKSSFVNTDIYEIPCNSVSPYISSTFSDVEEELKFLYTDTFPKLQELCQKRGVHFYPCDIRRTVVDSRTFSEHTLQHALDAVKVCQPYFMCIMGDKYGRYSAHTVNSSEHIEECPSLVSTIDINFKNAASCGHPWVMEEKYKDTSIMELEVEQAALSRDDVPKYCSFYVRDYKKMFLERTNHLRYTDYSNELAEDVDYIFNAESKFAEDKLNELKLKIANKGFHIYYFKSPIELGRLVFEQWSRIIVNLYPLPTSPISKYKVYLTCAVV